MNDKDNTLSNQIREYYLEILEREPSVMEIDSQITWINNNGINPNQLPLFFRESPEFQTLQTFKKIKSGPIKTNDGVMMYLNENDNVISRYLAYHKTWESYQTEIIKKYIQNNTQFIDIGANIGYYSLLVASRSKEGKIFSFEPELKNFQIFKQSVRINNFHNLFLYPYAISNRNGKVNFYLNTIGNAGDHRIFNDDLLKMNEKRICIEVESITLDDFLMKNCMEPDIIKMDIQGSEMLSLLGMNKILNETKKMILFVEFWPQGISATGESPEQFLTSLENFGFDIYEINSTINKIEKKSNEQLLLENTGNQKMYVETTLLCLKNTQPIFV